MASNVGAKVVSIAPVVALNANRFDREKIVPPLAAWTCVNWPPA